MEHRNTYEQEGDAVTWAEANMWVYRYGEISHTSAVSNIRCQVQIKIL